MSKLLKSKAGSIKANGPRKIGEILADVLHSDSPLATGYRSFLASRDNAEKGGCK